MYQHWTMAADSKGCPAEVWIFLNDKAVLPFRSLLERSIHKSNFENKCRFAVDMFQPSWRKLGIHPAGAWIAEQDAQVSSRFDVWIREPLKHDPLSKRGGVISQLIFVIPVAVLLENMENLLRLRQLMYMSREGKWQRVLTTGDVGDILDRYLCKEALSNESVEPARSVPERMARMELFALPRISSACDSIASRHAGADTSGISSIATGEGIASARPDDPESSPVNISATPAPGCQR